ncbi:hypothetical protein GCM10009560_42040 [Nonomuraea longicatena]|uniref:PKD domain-containing protein n=1 Tax=Nonomuraea longicatena TaxID=83682 RepID=A0ABN1PX58_9ACTN
MLSAVLVATCLGAAAAPELSASCAFSARRPVIEPGETIAVDFSFVYRGDGQDAQFTAVMLDNDFYGARHTYLTRTVSSGTGVSVSAHLTTGHLSPGTDDVTIEVSTSLTGATVLATCTTRLTVSGDTDGDALLDAWEIGGIDTDDDGLPDLTLAGADARRKDLYLEIDHMEFHELLPAARQDVVAAFAAAPVQNPDGSTGITMHIDEDEQLAHQDEVTTWDGFDTLKRGSFGTPGERTRPSALEAKRRAYHYVILGHRRDGGGSSGRAEIHGNDVLVTLGDNTWGLNAAGTHHVGTVNQQSGTLMHEFGHNLGLDHGGDKDVNCKPNYLSVMSYTWQTAHLLQTDGTRKLDYSRGKLLELNEKALVEKDGVGDGGTGVAIWSRDDGATTERAPAKGAIDWNKDGTESADPLPNPIDLNNLGIDGCGASPEDKLVGHDDWANLDYDFRDDPDYADGAHSPTPPEITGETAALLRDKLGPAFAPKAEAGGPYTVAENTPLTLAGAATGAGPLTYTWDFGDASAPAQGPAPTHVYGDDGAFTATLTVTDASGFTGKDTAIVTVSNTPPTAAIDGGQTRVARLGAPVEWSARVTDPGSDDLTLTWTWGDGQETSTESLVHPPARDPDPSPDVAPRDVRDVRSHTWTRPCAYGVRLQAGDDDGGQASDTATLIVTGDAVRPRLLAYWALRFAPGAPTPSCHLLTAQRMSRVFSEVVDVSTRARAYAVLTPAGPDPRRQLDAQALTAWLNFADGSPSLDQLVDTDVDRVPDTRFATVMDRAEAVRLDPGATTSEVLAQVAVLNSVNLG